MITPPCREVFNALKVAVIVVSTGLTSHGVKSGCNGIVTPWHVNELVMRSVYQDDR